MHCAHTAVGRWNDVNIVVKYSTKFRKLCIQLEWLNQKKGYKGKEKEGEGRWSRTCKLQPILLFLCQSTSTLINCILIELNFS